MDTPSQPYAYVKGQFVPEEAAMISIKERGFRFGDGIFDTLRISNGVPYQWEFHFNRIEKGLAELHIPARISSLRRIANELLSRNDVKDGILRISISRGVGSVGYLPAIDDDGPTLVMETLPLPAAPDSPATLWLSDIRKPAHDALPVQYKLMQGVNSTLARMEAHAHQCLDAIQLGPSGQLAETSSASLFWLRDYVLYTPATSAGALEGSVRHAIMRFSPYTVTTGNYPLSELEKADEVFITNAAWGVVPVATCQPVGLTWQPGPAITRLQEMLQEDIAHYVRDAG